MEKLGIEPIQLLTQIFNFLIMVFILTKMLYKPLTKKLEERRKRITEGLEYADKMKIELDENEKKREEIISKAKTEVRKIIEEGKKSGKKLEEDIISKAHKEAVSILEKARKEIKLERQEMEESLRSEAVKIAAVMAEKVLSDVLTVEDHQAIIDKKLKIIANLKKSSG
jgi:F-type H+-transporting ATPase subunit b